MRCGLCTRATAIYIGGFRGGFLHRTGFYLEMCTRVQDLSVYLLSFLIGSVLGILREGRETVVSEEEVNGQEAKALALRRHREWSGPHLPRAAPSFPDRG